MTTPENPSGEKLSGNAPEKAPLATTPEFSNAQIEDGRLLFARDITFMLSVVQLMQLPPPDRPEICFAGRSNVGKSSLINALTPRIQYAWPHARTKLLQCG